MDIMFEVPSANPAIKEVVINEDTIQKSEQPILIYQKGLAASGGDRSA
jgi:ATP-dependent protease Clp ATPase subunit